MAYHDEGGHLTFAQITDLLERDGTVEIDRTPITKYTGPVIDLDDPEPLLKIEVLPDDDGVIAYVGGTAIERDRSCGLDAVDSVPFIRKAVDEYSEWAYGPLRARIARDAVLVVVVITLTALCLAAVWAS